MTLPAWSTPLYDAAQMRALDAWAIESGVAAGVDLMERAGAAVARAVAELAPDGPIAIVCGKGNNGGDGLVAARLLHERAVGARPPGAVELLLTCDPGEFTGDAAANFERLPPGLEPRRFTAAALVGRVVVVDAILGAGATGAPRGPVGDAVNALAELGGRGGACPVLAVDLPSGVDATTGAVAGVAVRADVTVTFHAAKPGLYVSPGRQYAGNVRVVDIGIPAVAALESGAVAAQGLIERGVLDLIPQRADDSSKFSEGAVAVVGGSTGLTGAPCMAAEAAIRTGAGYVTAVVPASLNAIFEARLLEVMTVPIDDHAGAMQPSACAALIAAAGRVDACVIGPGAGSDPGTRGMLREVVRAIERPIVIDADGLNAFAGRIGELRDVSAAAVLTPHAGELARLLGVSAAEIESGRLAAVREAARASGRVTLLKGADTLVADPQGRVVINPGSAPALATAGSGDVLAGMIGALLAKGLDPFAAAAAGCLAHAEAARVAASSRGAGHVIARDLIDAIPAAMS